MPIAGLQKTTLIDYPGKVACTVFFSGCNFICPYCHNPDLAAGRLPAGGGFRIDALLSFLEERRGFLDAVVFSGGEPTLAPELMDLCREIKGLGFSIKLDTNGSRPSMLSRLIEKGLIDYTAMDLKTLPDRYHPHISPQPCAPVIEASIRFLGQSGAAHEFRTTCALPFVDGPLVAAMGRHIQGAPLWALQSLQTATMLNPGFSETPLTPLSPSEMAALQAIAAPFVERCILR